MSKSFGEAFQEWRQDNKYSIGDDIGDEFYDYLECPTHSDSSLASTENGPEISTEALLDCGEEAQ
jgi:hypothetical protein